MKRAASRRCDTDRDGGERRSILIRATGIKRGSGGYRRRLEYRRHDNHIAVELEGAVKIGDGDLMRVDESQIFSPFPRHRTIRGMRLMRWGRVATGERVRRRKTPVISVANTTIVTAQRLRSSRKFRDRKSTRLNSSH